MAGGTSGNTVISNRLAFFRYVAFGLLQRRIAFNSIRFFVFNVAKRTGRFRAVRRQYQGIRKIQHHSGRRITRVMVRFRMIITRHCILL